LRGVALPLAAKIFAVADIEYPVQLVLDAPVPADDRVQSCRIGLHAGDVAANLVCSLPVALWYRFASICTKPCNDAHSVAFSSRLRLAITERRRSTRPGPQRIGWHAFRRTAVTLLMASGSSIKTTQELMRHATADIKLELYAQAVTEDKREAQKHPCRSHHGTQSANVQTGVSA
jgi:hypothetical protein